MVIVTGGLGSTGDDLTARAAARATRQQLAINEQALEMVHNWFRKRNRPMERMTALPREKVACHTTSFMGQIRPGRRKAVKRILGQQTMTPHLAMTTSKTGWKDSRPRCASLF